MTTIQANVRTRALIDALNNHKEWIKNILASTDPENVLFQNFISDERKGEKICTTILEHILMQKGFLIKKGFMENFTTKVTIPIGDFSECFKINEIFQDEKNQAYLKKELDLIVTVKLINRAEKVRALIFSVKQKLMTTNYPL